MKLHLMSTGKRAAVAALAAASLLPASSAQAADVVVTLDRAFLERAVEDAVTRTAVAAEPRLYWGHVSGRRVEITREDQDSINIDLDLAFDVKNAPDPEIDVDVNFPTWLVVATGGLSWVANHVVNVIVDKKLRSVDDMRQQVMQQVNQQLGQVGFQFCPAFNVTPGANVEVVFGAWF